MRLGRIPDAVVFGGQRLDHSIPGGILWRCRACGLLFKFPHLGKDELDALYLRVGAGAWDTVGVKRIDWNLAYRYLADRPPADILDVGCFDGRFLQGLGGAWRRSGVEINAAAADRAAAAGITIAGHDFSALAGRDGSFSVITAFDVIEHVLDPRAFLDACRRALRVEGLLILATGNAHSWPWRLHGPRSLYCICAEHVSFLTPAWLTRTAATSGWKMRQLQYYRRTSVPWTRNVRDVSANLVYALAPRIIERLRVAGWGRSTDRRTALYPPQWPSARDHMFAVLARDGE